MYYVTRNFTIDVFVLWEVVKWFLCPIKYKYIYAVSTIFNQDLKPTWSGITYESILG